MTYHTNGDPRCQKERERTAKEQERTARQQPLTLSISLNSLLDVRALSSMFVLGMLDGPTLALCWDVEGPSNRKTRHLC